MIGSLKWVNAGAAVGLCFLVYGTQKKIWKLDMRDLEGSQPRQFAKAEPLLEKSYVAAKECTF